MMPKQRLRENQSGEIVVQQYNSRLLKKWEPVARFKTVQEAVSNYPKASWRGPRELARIVESAS